MAAAASVPGSDATRLDGKTAVVTGASSGIGRAIARELALAGADVVVHARASHAQLDRVVDELRATGRRALAILADLASAPAHAALIEQAWTWAGDIQIWVNNAGGDVLTGSAAEWPFEQKLEYLWQVDVRGTILLSREVGRRMIERAGDARDRCILNMGWDQVEGGMAGDSRVSAERPSIRTRRQTIMASPARRRVASAVASAANTINAPRMGSNPNKLLPIGRSSITLIPPV